MSNIFSSVKITQPKRTAFNLSHENKLSLKMAQLIPILCAEVVPGDRMQLQSEIMLRFAPLISPVMHRVNVYTYSFFVPNRLIWENWETFITKGVDGLHSPVAPYITVNDLHNDMFTRGSLADYLGVPPLDYLDNPENSLKVSSLPFRAYQLIYNEYFRDQNLMDEIIVPKTDGEDNIDSDTSLIQLRKKCWEKDYFTSALPWTQRGGDVRLPLSGDAPIVTSDPDGLGLDPVLRKPGNMDFDSEHEVLDTNRISADHSKAALGIQNNTEDNLYFDPNGSLKADLSGVNSTTINELRRSIRLQEWLEKNARAGSRYIEQILSHFGVRSSDYRLQRPEFLGGGKSPVVVSEVLQTSETTSSSPQANMSGHAISVGNQHGFGSHKFTEHGFVITLMCVLPRTQYMQGLPKMFSRFDNMEYYWPEFAHLGEQPIANRELYIDPTMTKDQQEGTFGYTSRYADYKYIPSAVHGEFRNTSAGGLSFWHMARAFNNLPTLSPQFVEADPTSRIFAVDEQNVENLYCQIYHRFTALRPMPKYGTPTL